MLTGLALFFMTNHNFMTNEYAIFILMWTSVQLKKNTSFYTFKSFSNEEKAIIESGPKKNPS